jgi:hypothetical protein
MCATYNYGTFEIALHTILGATPVFRAGFGQGSGPIFVDNTACVGTEAELLFCRANEVGVHNCDHSEDAGAICAPLIVPPSKTLLAYSCIQCRYTDNFVD